MELRSIRLTPHCMSMNPKSPSQFRLAKNNFKCKEGPGDTFLSSANAFIKNHQISVLYQGDRFKVVADNRFGSTFKTEHPEEQESYLFSVFGKTYTIVRDPGNVLRMYGMVKYGNHECINEADVIRLHARPGNVGNGDSERKLCKCPQFTQNWMEHVYTNHN